jgi:hypothetical protein
MVDRPWDDEERRRPFLVPKYAIRYVTPQQLQQASCEGRVYNYGGTVDARPAIKAGTLQEPSMSPAVIERWCTHTEALPHDNCRIPKHCNCNCSACVAERGGFHVEVRMGRCICVCDKCPHCSARIAALENPPQVEEHTEFTDSQRLEWMLGHIGADFDFNVSDGKAGEHWITWYAESHYWCVHGASWIECIDQALRGEAKRLER